MSTIDAERAFVKAQFALTIAELRSLLLESAEKTSRASVLLVAQHRTLADLETLQTVKGCAADALSLATFLNAHADKLIRYLKGPQ